MEQLERNHYEQLGVNCDASDQTIRQAYHRLARLLHPDKTANSDLERFHEVQVAWTVLSDPVSRSRYDDSIRSQLLAYRLAWNAAEDVELDEFTQEEDMWVRPCRCGDGFRVHSEDLDQLPLLIACEGCSLHVKLTKR